MGESLNSAEAWFLDILEPIPPATHTELIHTPSCFLESDFSVPAIETGYGVSPSSPIVNQEIGCVDATPAASADGVTLQFVDEALTETKSATPSASVDGVDGDAVEKASIPCPVGGNHLKWPEGPDPPICPLCAEMRRSNLTFLGTFFPGVLSLI